ncbi:MAG: hypothetical protein ACRBF0_12015 [Calditrichia bacterium]
MKSLARDRFYACRSAGYWVVLMVMMFGFVSDLMGVDYRWSQTERHTRLIFVTNNPLEIMQAQTDAPVTRIFCQIEEPFGEASALEKEWEVPALSAVHDLHLVRFGSKVHLTLYLYGPVTFEVNVMGHRSEIVLMDSLYRDPLTQAFLMGVNLQRRGELAHAMERYRHVLEQDSLFATAYFKAGQIRMQWSDFAKAEINLRKAIQLGCDSIGVHKAMADLFRSRGNEGRARRLYQKYHKLAKQDALPEEISGFNRKGIASIQLAMPAWAKQQAAGWGNGQSVVICFIAFVLLLCLLRIGWQLWLWKRDQNFKQAYRRGFVPTDQDFYDASYTSVEEEQVSDSQGYFNPSEHVDDSDSDNQNTFYEPVGSSVYLQEPRHYDLTEEDDFSAEKSDSHSLQNEGSRTEADVDKLIRMLLKEDKLLDSAAPLKDSLATLSNTQKLLSTVLHHRKAGLTLAQIARRTGLGQEDILLLLWLEQQRILLYGKQGVEN